MDIIEAAKQGAARIREKEKVVQAEKVKQLMASEVSLDKDRQVYVEGTEFLHPDLFLPTAELKMPDLLKFEQGERDLGGLVDYWENEDLAASYFKKILSAVEILSAPVPDKGGTIDHRLATKLIIRDWNQVLFQNTHTKRIMAITTDGTVVSLPVFITWLKGYSHEIALATGFWHITHHTDASILEESAKGLRVNVDLQQQLKHYLQVTKTEKVIRDGKDRAQISGVALAWMAARKSAIMAEIEALDKQRLFSGNPAGLATQIKDLKDELHSVKGFAEDFAAKKYADHMGEITTELFSRLENVTPIERLHLNSILAYQNYQGDLN